MNFCISELFKSEAIGIIPPSARVMVTILSVRQFGHTA